MIKTKLQAIVAKEQEMAEMDRKLDIAKRVFDELEQRIVSHRKEEERFAEIQREISERGADVTEREKAIKRREQDLARREINWLKSEDKIKTLKEELREQKDALDMETKTKMAELEKLDAEWMHRREEMEALGEDLEIKKDNVDNLIKTDLKQLALTENEIVRKVKQLENDKLKLKKEETALLKDVKKFETEEAKLKRELKPIKKKEAHARRLEREAKKKHTQAKHLLEKAKKIAKGLEQAKKKKKGFKALSNQIPSLERKMMGLQPSKVKAKPAVPKAPAEEAMEEVSKPVRMPAVAEIAAGEMSHEEKTRLQALIDQAKNLIHNGNVAGARQMLAQIEQEHRKIKDSPDKRMIGYDIMDLKTSLKLASLS